MKQQDRVIAAIILAGLIIGSFIFLGIYVSRPKITGRDIGDGNKLPPIPISKPEHSFVTKIIDGDTVVVNGESVRLLGIDADERGYPCYKEAKQRIEELLLNKEIELEIEGENKDQYKRYLRYIFLNGKNINLQLVEEGLAVARFYPQNIKYKTEILAAEKQAREDKIGCKWKEKSEEDEKKQEQEEQEQKKSESEPKPEEQNLDYECSQNVYNCEHFITHIQAQKVYEFCGGLDNDIHRLDGDEDGLACESLT